MCRGAELHGLEAVDPVGVESREAQARGRGDGGRGELDQRDERAVSIRARDGVHEAVVARLVAAHGAPAVQQRALGAVERRPLGGGFVDGAIVVSAREDDPITAALERLHIPTVLVGRPETAPELPSVSIDNRTAARDITERLVATGRRRIGMIAAALDRDSGRDRLAGFRDALGDAFDETLVVEVPLYSFHAGQEGMRRLLDRAPDVDGVFASSDAIAAGAVDVLKEAGKRIPGDIGVVGFDDSVWALRCQPALSTVRQPAGSLGARAAELVLDEIRRGERQRGVVLLPTEVVWRDSA